MRHIKTQIEIDATPATVWEILSNFKEYPLWNPMIPQISGEMKTGESLALTLKMGNGKQYKFTPTIQELIPEEKLVWKGKLLIPGLFDGEHHFRLDKAGKKTTFIHEEFFSGVLTYLLPKSIFSATQESFEKLNLAIKERAEA